MYGIEVTRPEYRRFSEFKTVLPQAESFRRLQEYMSTIRRNPDQQSHGIFP